MGKGILAGASGGGTNIPVTSDPADNVQIWIDPNEEDQNEQFYTKIETEDYVKLTAALKDLSNVDSTALLAAIESAGGGAAKIATGTYEGTGKAGSSDVNTLTFDFKPQFVIVLPGTVTSGNENYYIVLCSMLTESYKNNCIMANSGNNTVFGGSFCRLTNANQLQWYSNSGSGYQLNDSGKTYHYIAIG